MTKTTKYETGGCMGYVTPYSSKRCSYEGSPHFIFSILWCLDVAIPVSDGLFSHYSYSSTDKTKPVPLHDFQSNLLKINKSFCNQVTRLLTCVSAQGLTHFPTELLWLSTSWPAESVPAQLRCWEQVLNHHNQYHKWGCASWQRKCKQFHYKSLRSCSRFASS